MGKGQTFQERLFNLGQEEAGTVSLQDRRELGGAG